MTKPEVVCEKFFAACIQAWDGGSNCVAGLLRVVCFLPAMFFLFFVEILVGLERVASASPKVKVLPISIAAVRRAPASGREGA